MSMLQNLLKFSPNLAMIHKNLQTELLKVTLTSLSNEQVPSVILQKLLYVSCNHHACFARTVNCTVPPQPFLKSSPGHEGQTGQLYPLHPYRYVLCLALQPVSKFSCGPELTVAWKASCWSPFVFKGNPKATCSPQTQPEGWRRRAG